MEKPWSCSTAGGPLRMDPCKRRVDAVKKDIGSTRQFWGKIAEEMKLIQFQPNSSRKEIEINNKTMKLKLSIKSITSFYQIKPRYGQLNQGTGSSSTMKSIKNATLSALSIHQSHKYSRRIHFRVRAHHWDGLCAASEQKAWHY